MSMTAIADAGTDEQREKQVSESRKALVKDLTTRVKQARTFWKPVFERVRDNIRFAGGDQWQDAEEKMADAVSDKYQVNFVQRELNQQVSAIYAKNPNVVCERRKRLEYTVWDGTDQQLQQSQLILQQAAPLMLQAAQAQQMIEAYQQDQAGRGFFTRDLNEPFAITQAKQVVNSIPAPVKMAQAVVQDYMQGVARKTLFDKICETGELVFNEQLNEQQPDFESQMKDLVLREKTTGAGFVAVKFQRVNEAVVATSADTAGLASRTARVTQLLEESQEDDLSEAMKEELRLELQAVQTALSNEQRDPELEGLIYDFKPTTSIIIDPKCRSLFKFLGADWVAEELMLTPEQVEAQWQKEVTSGAVPYTHGTETKDQTNLNTKAGGANDRDNTVSGNWPDKATVCVWVIYDKAAGLKYTVCDGFEDFLEEPEAPWPAVKGFWTVVALKLNRLEVEENNPKAGITIYGQSSVQLMKPMQEEMNRTQEALREHRLANRPGHICGKDTFDKNDRAALAGRGPHDVIPLSNVPPGGDCSKVLWPVPVNPIDPRLYDTNGVMQQVLLVSGMQQANMGAQGVNDKATGQAIAEQSRIVGVSSEVDSLNTFLCELARIGGEMLFQEMTLETVKKIAGPGAVWPNDPANRQSINECLYLKIEAGSMGRPNRAMEIDNLQTMMPQLIQLAQLKGLPLDPLVKYAAKVLEFDFDIDEWLASAQPMMPQPGQLPPGQTLPGAQQQTPPGQPPTDPSQQAPTVPGGGMVKTMLTKAQNVV